MVSRLSLTTPLLIGTFSLFGCQSSSNFPESKQTPIYNRLLLPEQPHYWLGPGEQSPGDPERYHGRAEIWKIGDN